MVVTKGLVLVALSVSACNLPFFHPLGSLVSVRCWGVWRGFSLVIFFIGYYGKRLIMLFLIESAKPVSEKLGWLGAVKEDRLLYFFTAYNGWRVPATKGGVP